MEEQVVLLTASYGGKPLEIVKRFVPSGFSLVTMETNAQEELEEKAACADYILASGKLKINEKVVTSAYKLKMVQRLGVGLDSLDLKALHNVGIPVYVNQGVNSDSVAEHTVMLALASLRRLPTIVARTKSGIWKKQEQGIMTRELCTQTIGIVGMGNIGKKVARILSGFGCTVIYYDPHRLGIENESELNIRYAGLDELFSESDVITLHCPLTNNTKEIISRTSIDQMKDGVIIINTSRGGLINETDLLNALEIGKVGTAALDVFVQEPIIDFALAKHENVICTPHIAGNTFDSFERMMHYAMRNIELFAQGNLGAIEAQRVGLQETN